ncbi:MAG: hypothetical protein NDI62_01350 [Burkholderiales bacterium]|nr:hypothetical protein [Burkholderiales bacterium]
MTPKIKNIILFTLIAAALILVYVFFIKKDATEEESLVSSTESDIVSTDTLNQNSEIAQNLLSVLLGVKNIKLEDSIFSEKSFLNLRDSSIILNSTGDEGRINPFAPIGYENLVSPLPGIGSTTPAISGTAPSLETNEEKTNKTNVPANTKTAN